MKNCKGLSLIEILVALIITGIIAACVSAAVLGGYYMLKQAEHKSRAMSISHVKLQEYLAKSFNELTDNDTGNDSSISEQFSDTADNTYFNWTVNVTPDDTKGPVPVPYKNVTVQTVYTEVDVKGRSVSNKTVQLSNMVPYPLIHINSTAGNFTATDHSHRANKAVPLVPGGKWDEAWDDGNYNWVDIRPTPSLNGILAVNYSVPKDMIVMYNLAVNYADVGADPAVDDTVYTRCVLENGTQYGIITRTPIMTQVFINNILNIDNATAGAHTIRVQWSKDGNADVWLRGYDVTVVAVEHTDKKAVSIP
jgi:prepilin-type N-terminal cleavage/methylation domain-containing protein